MCDSATQGDLRALGDGEVAHETQGRMGGHQRQTGRANPGWGDSISGGRVCSSATQGNSRALGDGEVAPKLEGKVKYMSVKQVYLCEGLAGDATPNHRWWGGRRSPNCEAP